MPADDAAVLAHYTDQYGGGLSGKPIAARSLEQAAALAAVDLAISVDCPAADMAGAMGLRCWTLLPHVAEWRWAEAGGHCRWYPTITPFRQDRPGDWDSAVAAAARSLSRLAGG